MKIGIDPHTLERAKERGASKEEIEEEVIYVLEGDTITTVTVYVFYGAW